MATVSVTKQKAIFETILQYTDGLITEEELKTLVEKITRNYSNSYHIALCAKVLARELKGN